MESMLWVSQIAYCDTNPAGMQMCALIVICPGGSQLPVIIVMMSYRELCVCRADHAPDAHKDTCQVNECYHACSLK